jgi:hypothetical protein
MPLTTLGRGSDHKSRASCSQDMTWSGWTLVDFGKLEHSLEVLEHYLQHL